MDQPIALSDRMLASLNATRPWVKFIAIVGFIFAALSVFFGMLMITGLYTGFPKSGVADQLNPVMGILYIVSALLFDVIPALYLYRYAKAIAGIQESASASSFEDALKQQRSFWKYMGIVFMILAVIFVLGIVVAVVAGLSAGLHRY